MDAILVFGEEQVWSLFSHCHLCHPATNDSRLIRVQIFDDISMFTAVSVVYMHPPREKTFGMLREKKCQMVAYSLLVCSIGYRRKCDLCRRVPSFVHCTMFSDFHAAFWWRLWFHWTGRKRTPLWYLLGGVYDFNYGMCGPVLLLMLANHGFVLFM